MFLKSIYTIKKLVKKFVSKLKVEFKCVEKNSIKKKIVIFFRKNGNIVTKYFF
jgi:hypothetical protein